LEEGVRRFVRRGEEHDAAGLLRDLIENRDNRGWRGGPDQEYGIDASQGCGEGLWVGEVSFYYVHVGWQNGILRASG
jgi:hypothetical protein